MHQIVYFITANCNHLDQIKHTLGAMASCKFEVPKPNPANTLPPRPETFYFAAKLDITGQGMHGVCVDVDTKGDNKQVPIICIVFDENLRVRSGLRLTMNLSAAPITTYGDGYTVLVLEKNARYKYTINQHVNIGGEHALEWNFCADVHYKHHSLFDTTWEVYARSSMIFKIQMKGGELWEIESVLRSAKQDCAVLAFSAPPKRKRLIYIYIYIYMCICIYMYI